jgi:predicted hydrocarbon binding protein/KaiC/GvpD/RAD55 family RecA-like ATPase
VPPYFLRGVFLASLSQLQEVPSNNLILLVGPPGSGKTTFCQQSIIQNVAMDRPILYVTTDYGPSEAENALKGQGLANVEPGLINYVDAYNETVGVSVKGRSDTISADCNNLSSIDIAIAKLQERIERKGILLVFDSLTSPYLFSESGILRFMRMTLSRFAARGNAVLACIDEGCGKSEDLVAMMSLANGAIKIDTEKGKWIIDVVKHPQIKQTKIEIPIERDWKAKLFNVETWDQKFPSCSLEILKGGTQMVSLKKDVREQFLVNMFWLNFAIWSGMFWDPKRFPIMSYEVWKELGNMARYLNQFVPWYWRTFFKLYMPKSFSKVGDMKKLLRFLKGFEQMGFGIFEYCDDISSTDEHYFRVHESFECWGFANVGTSIASILPSRLAGACKGLESLQGLERDWNAIETKCIGLGDPYCEFKLVPGEINGLRDSLEKDSFTVEKINKQLISSVTKFILEGKPLVERPTLGSDFVTIHPDITLTAIASERCRMALRMGGVKSGKEVGKSLMEAGIIEDEAVGRIRHFLEYCKVGKINLGETIRIEENRESLYTKILTTKWDEPSCFFTTGFLNGFFSIVNNQHVKETRCLGMGDPYCEWEFR